MTRFRHAHAGGGIKAAILATASIALIAGTANAQTTIITREPAPPRTVVTTEAPVLQLTPVQRHRIYRAIVRERVEPPRARVEYRVGRRIPPHVRLYEVPQEIAVEVPAIEDYKYMVVNNQVVLVDPATSEVVAELAD